MKFEELLKINVNEHTENKNGLTYLSWVWGWSEFKKQCPQADYEIIKQENGLPYVYDENTGYMVFTRATDGNEWKEMWLPVMDGNNKAMLSHSYTYKVKEYKDGKATGNYIEKTVEPATMFDINKTIMRCLTKNLAMFGLGLYIYAGEDLPEGYEISKEEAERIIINFGKYEGKTLKEIKETDSKYLIWMVSQENTKQNLKEAISKIMDLPSEEESKQRISLINEINNLILETETDYDDIYKHFKIKSFNELTVAQLDECKKILEKKLSKMESE